MAYKELPERMKKKRGEGEEEKWKERQKKSEGWKKRIIIICTGATVRVDRHMTQKESKIWGVAPLTGPWEQHIHTQLNPNFAFSLFGYSV